MTPPSLSSRFEAAIQLLRAQRHGEALAAFDEILQVAPDHLPALASRGTALVMLRRNEEAEANWRRALALHPHHPVILWNLGHFLLNQGRTEDALDLAQAAAAEQPGHGRALLLWGDALIRQSRFEEALETLEQLPATGEMAAETLSKQGAARAGLGQYEAALALLDRAVALNPDAAFPRFRRAGVRLALRDFSGWSDWESRWRDPAFIAQSGTAVTPAIARRLTLAPTRADLAGRRVLLLAEQGIGDEVMFSSLIPDLREIAASVICVCEARLVRLFSASLPGVTFVSIKEARINTAEIDLFVAMGSLAAAFRPTEASFPGTPFLAARAPARARWAERLGPSAGRLRVGLSWRGGVASTRTRQRSLDWDALRPILDVPGCEFVSLQYGDVAAELAAAPRPIRAFPRNEIDDFEDLAALTAELDLVVSVQTALVHVCGAIGQTCLTLVPCAPEWRYGVSGETMPWYRSVRLFRQTAEGEWRHPVHEVAQALRARLAPSSAPDRLET